MELFNSLPGSVLFIPKEQNMATATPFLLLTMKMVWSRPTIIFIHILRQRPSLRSGRWYLSEHWYVHASAFCHTSWHYLQICQSSCFLVWIGNNENPSIEKPHYKFCFQSSCTLSQYASAWYKGLHCCLQTYLITQQNKAWFINPTPGINILQLLLLFYRRWGMFYCCAKQSSLGWKFWRQSTIVPVPPYIRQKYNWMTRFMFKCVALPWDCCSYFLKEFECIIICAWVGN